MRRKVFTCPLSPLPCYTLSFSTKNNNNFHQTKRVCYMFLSFSNHVAPQGLGFGLPFFLSMLNQLIWLVDPNMIIIPISNMDRACMCCSIWWDRNYKYYILGQKFFPLGCGPIFTLIFQNCHHFSIIYPPLRNTEPLFSTCSLFHWGAYLCFVASFPFQTILSNIKV